MKDQIRSLRNGDGPEMLQQRLALLPPEIEGIYLSMLQQIDRPYKQEACHFLRMALHRPRMSHLEHALASYKGLEDMLLSPDEKPKREMYSLCLTVQKRTMVICVGFLEVHQSLYPSVEIEHTSKRSDTDTENLRSGPDDTTLAFDSDEKNLYDSERPQEVGLDRHSRTVG